MADTLIKLIMDIQNKIRTTQKKNYREMELLDMKRELLYNNLKNEFLYGVKYKYFTNILHNEIINSMLYDLVLYDYVVINIGVKTLKSIIKNDNIIFSKKSISIPISDLDDGILNIVSVYFYKEDIIIHFEYSDNEGRMIIKPKDNIFKSRPNIRIIDFPLYNFIILSENKDNSL
jgi:hypothetical protein